MTLDQLADLLRVTGYAVLLIASLLLLFMIIRMQCRYAINGPNNTILICSRSRWHRGDHRNADGTTWRTTNDWASR